MMMSGYEFLGRRLPSMVAFPPFGFAGFFRCRMSSRLGSLDLAAVIERATCWGTVVGWQFGLYSLAFFNLKLLISARREKQMLSWLLLLLSILTTYNCNLVCKAPQSSSQHPALLRGKDTRWNVVAMLKGALAYRVDLAKPKLPATHGALWISRSATTKT